jgi:hypothetical protein
MAAPLNALQMEVSDSSKIQADNDSKLRSEYHPKLAIVELATDSRQMSSH